MPRPAARAAGVVQGQPSGPASLASLAPRGPGGSRRSRAWRASCPEASWSASTRMHDLGVRPGSAGPDAAWTAHCDERVAREAVRIGPSLDATWKDASHGAIASPSGVLPGRHAPLQEAEFLSASSCRQVLLTSLVVVQYSQYSETLHHPFLRNGRRPARMQYGVPSGWSLGTQC